MTISQKMMLQLEIFIEDMLMTMNVKRMQEYLHMIKSFVFVQNISVLLYIILLSLPQ
jgi:hypothetical protein